MKTLAKTILVLGGFLAVAYGVVRYGVQQDEATILQRIEDAKQRNVDDSVEWFSNRKEHPNGQVGDVVLGSG